MPKKKKVKGLNAHRYKENPDEQKFAEFWERQNQEKRGTLAYLLSDGEQHNPPEPSERDHVVAATVIQWLGSPVGQLWLSEVGFIKVPTLAIKKPEENIIRVMIQAHRDGGHLPEMINSFLAAAKVIYPKTRIKIEVK